MPVNQCMLVGENNFKKMKEGPILYNMIFFFFYNEIDMLRNYDVKPICE